MAVKRTIAQLEADNLALRNELARQRREHLDDICHIRRQRLITAQSMLDEASYTEDKLRAEIRLLESRLRLRSASGDVPKFIKELKAAHKSAENSKLKFD